MYVIRNLTNKPKKFFNRIASKWVVVPASGRVESDFGFESNEVFEVTEKESEKSINKKEVKDKND